MDPVIIKSIVETPSAWRFNVAIGTDPDTTRHKVVLNKKYWRDLTQETITPEQLIIKSFLFLLAREKKESILNSFNLPIIGTFFPEYEEEITNIKAKDVK
jgi:hypothetical protein